MTPEEKEKYQYRFSGYQLPKIQLDATGPSYYVMQPHPYYYNQPLYWQKEFFFGLSGGSGAPKVAPETGEKLWPFMPDIQNP